jgi:hypothetical protein
MDGDGGSLSDAPPGARNLTRPRVDVETGRPTPAPARVRGRRLLGKPVAALATAR